MEHTQPGRHPSRIRVMRPPQHNRPSSASAHGNGPTTGTQSVGERSRRRTWSAAAPQGAGPAQGPRRHGAPHHRRDGGPGHGAPKRGPSRGGGGRGSSGRGRPTILRRPKTQPAHNKIDRPQTGKLIPPPEAGVLRVIPLGGVEEIGKNMTVIETADDILIVDAGFQFSEVETPGVDFILSGR